MEGLQQLIFQERTNSCSFRFDSKQICSVRSQMRGMHRSAAHRTDMRRMRWDKGLGKFCQNSSTESRKRGVFTSL